MGYSSWLEFFDLKLKISSILIGESDKLFNLIRRYEPERNIIIPEISRKVL
jgi:hypothetical protein